jgi:hypothetical protein
MSKADKIKLHLGCGANYLFGYVNIDSNKDILADLYIDYLEIDNYFSVESIKEILMIHSIGYLNLWQARDFFRKAFKLLDNDGVFILETPNLMNAINMIQSSYNLNIEDYYEGIRALHAFDMQQVNNREKIIPYAFSWSPWHLEQELKDAGFVDVRLLKPQTHVPWRDMRIEACKKNVELLDDSATFDKRNPLVEVDSKQINNASRQYCLRLKKGQVMRFWSRLKLAIRYVFEGS